MALVRLFVGDGAPVTEIGQVLVSSDSSVRRGRPPTIAVATAGGPPVLALSIGKQGRTPAMSTPKTCLFVGREHSKSMVSSASIESAAQAQVSLASLANVGTGASAFGPAIFGEFAANLRPGAVAGCSSGQVLAPIKAAAPGDSELFRESAFDGPAP